MIRIADYHSGTWTDMFLDLDDGIIMLAHGPTPLDTLIEAERVLRADLTEVQRLLTAEREKTRDATKPVSPTY